MGHLSDTNPERNAACSGDQRPLRRIESLPYRLRETDASHTKTADVPSQASNNDIDLAPPQTSLDSEILPTTILPQLSTERSLQREPESPKGPSVPMTSPPSTDNQEQIKSGLGLRHRSSTSGGHPPRIPLSVRSSHRAFSMTSRSVSNPGHSAERATLDGTTAEVPFSTSSPAGHGPNQLSTSQTGSYLPRDPPAYQPRPLTIQQRQRPPGRLRRLTSPRNIERRLYQVFEWIRLIFLDVFFLFFFLAITGIILQWAQLWRMNDRVFPMTYEQLSGTWYGPLEISYPRHDFILGITTTTIMIPLIPLAVLILMQFWIRSWLDFHAAFFALKKAMVMM